MVSDMRLEGKVYFQTEALPNFRRSFATWLPPPAWSSIRGMISFAWSETVARDRQNQAAARRAG